MDCAPEWDDDPDYFGVSEQQIAAVQKVPFGWYCSCPDDAPFFVRAGLAITISLLAADASGIVEIADDGSAFLGVYPDGKEIGTHWMSAQISFAPPGDLDPTLRVERLKREKEAERAEKEARRASYDGPDLIEEMMSKANDPNSSMPPDRRERLLRSHFVYEWTMARLNEKFACFNSVYRGITDRHERGSHPSLAPGLPHITTVPVTSLIAILGVWVECSGWWV